MKVQVLDARLFMYGYNDATSLLNGLISVDEY
jgi:hypothetical protein